jgi:predicted negative regulator of RcsB-dependent stress response
MHPARGSREFLSRLAAHGSRTLCALVLASAGHTLAQGQVSGESQFSTSQTLFATLAAINAAGYDTGINSALNDRYQLRTEVRHELAKRTIPCLPEMKDFYRTHRKPSGGADLGQYISFALLAGDPPKFELPAGELPPDVEPLRGFSELLARFYKEANLADLWRRSGNAYVAAMSEYQEQVINALFEANGYLRNPSGNEGRRFQIFLDLLGEPNQAQVRNYRANYFVVITPSSAPLVDEIRDAYLTYLVDPLSFKFSAAIKQKQSLEKFAESAPALDLAYKDDFQLLVTKCLIKAIDSRMMHGGAGKREAFVDQAMSEGFILTASFAESLERYEKQPDAFRLYYPEMIAAVDVKKEKKRLEGTQFVESVAPKVVAPPAKMQVQPAEESLETAEGLYEQSDLENAQTVFKKVFEQTADQVLHGRAYYGLARIAIRENQVHEAKQLFERTVENNPGPAITGWAHVYLGRIALHEKDDKKAKEQFTIALATEGISAQARDAAEKGLESSSLTGDKQK